MAKKKEKKKAGCIAADSTGTAVARYKKKA